MKLLAHLQKIMPLDLRALALMRIAVAFVILLDLSIRVSDLEAFYVNTGAAPLAMIMQYKWNDYYISFHAISGLWQVQLLLFIFAACCALMLLIGYRTRLFTVLSWIMLLSLHNRNVLILQGGDDLLRMTLFWGIFLPWGKRYSCDRMFSEDDTTDTRIFTLATLAYMLQITYVYTGSALLKGPEWHTHFTALYYVYSLDQIAYPVTRYLYYYPELLSKLTALAYWFELLVPLLFFVPYKNQLFRGIGVAGVFLFHLGNGATLLIGLFFVIGIVTTVGLLPPVVMDAFDRNIGRIRNYMMQSFAGIAWVAGKVVRWKPERDILSSGVSRFVLLVLTVYVLFWNASNLSFNHYKLADEVRFAGYTLRIDQNWGMFAPGVFKDDGWYVMEGTTLKGHKKFDLFHPNDSLSYKKPESVVAMFKNDRWRKYSENFIFVSNSFMRGYFCNYYIRKWNEANPDRPVSHLSILYFTELTLPDYKYSIPKKDVLCSCTF
jgi:hypothetical protein